MKISVSTNQWAGTATKRARSFYLNIGRWTFAFCIAERKQ